MDKLSHHAEKMLTNATNASQHRNIEFSPTTKRGREEWAQPRKAVMTRLWQRMREAFGNKWVIDYGSALDEYDELTSTADMWADCLSGFSLEQIGAAFAGMVRGNREWPPNLSEFTALCQEHSQEAHEQPMQVALPKLPDREKGLAAIDGLKAALRG